MNGTHAIVSWLVLQVSGREVFEFRPELVDDDDDEADDTKYTKDDDDYSEDETNQVRISDINPECNTAPFVIVKTVQY